MSISQNPACKGYVIGLKSDHDFGSWGKSLWSPAPRGEIAREFEPDE